MINLSGRDLEVVKLYQAIIEAISLSVYHDLVPNSTNLSCHPSGTGFVDERELLSQPCNSTL